MAERMMLFCNSSAA